MENINKLGGKGNNRRSSRKVIEALRAARSPHRNRSRRIIAHLRSGSTDFTGENLDRLLSL